MEKAALDISQNEAENEAEIKLEPPIQDDNDVPSDEDSLGESCVDTDDESSDEEANDETDEEADGESDSDQSDACPYRKNKSSKPKTKSDEKENKAAKKAAKQAAKKAEKQAAKKAAKAAKAKKNADRKAARKAAKKAAKAAKQAEKEEKESEANSGDSESETDSGTGAEVKIILPRFLAALKQTNKLRKQHGAKKLDLDTNLNKDCEEWAKKMHKNGKMKHSSGTGNGENLYWHSSSKDMDRMTNAVNSWYSEVEYYKHSQIKDTGHPNFSNATGHFTALVWKKTTKMGIGQYIGNNGCYVVARYNPPGNMGGAYKENVGKLE